jgi:hypothetical protein
MSSSHGTIVQFLDDLKPGWGATYGATLQAWGLEDQSDAQDFSERELNDLLGRALREAGAPPFHVARIVKRLFIINNEQGYLQIFYTYILSSNIYKFTADVSTTNDNNDNECEYFSKERYGPLSNGPFTPKDIADCDVEKSMYVPPVQ